MKPLAQTLSLLALAGTVLPALLFFGGILPLAAVKTWILVATVAWFSTATIAQPR